MQVPLEELLRDMPEELKGEVYDFARFLVAKRLREDEREWNLLSLWQASRGLEEENLYDERDLKARWR